jgi:hypothetical protein|tara:strand:+ start:2137 stop:2295 length:159 start_codon:yes stop_codon:yes gene_type:complete
MKSHIYKFKGNWKLIITSGAAISQGVISEKLYATKTLARQAAKEFGAQPWNY